MNVKEVPSTGNSVGAEISNKTYFLYMLTLCAYVSMSMWADTLNPFGWVNGVKHRNKIESNYQNSFKDCKTFEDSLEVYRERGWETKLVPPTFEQKENALEKKSKN